VDGVFMVYEVGPMPVKAVPKSVAFNENFGKKWGNDARLKLSGHGPGPSYDAVYIMASAFERAGTVEPDAVVKALELHNPLLDRSFHFTPAIAGHTGNHAALSIKNN
jgi:ABC-type branched-subunit amino acid transport system substrate-binding protein